MVANKKTYKAPRLLPFSSTALGVAIVLAAAALLLLPLTQYLAGDPSDSVTVRQINVSIPPPPPPPPEPPPPEDQQQEEPPPQMTPPPPMLSLNQLAMAINPGVGAALAGDFSLGEVGTVSSAETVEEMKLFSVDELDRRPTLLGQPRIEFPRRLISRYAGEVVSIIFRVDVNGEITYLETAQQVHPTFEEIIVSEMERSRMSKGTVGGQPVSFRYTVNVRVQ